ncbi:chromo (CHRromatin organization MOdifier) domain-containing protein [Ditylenchus destructor]|nr:chromo (CHRromatin organization MOdifier) domain-containing protein [Ditylenchus destructor]
MTEERLKTEVSTQSDANLFDDKENLIVEKILDKRQNGDQTQYLVKFLGYEDDADHKWISHDMLNCHDMVSQYECAQNEVVEILDKRVENNTTEYKVKMKSSKESRWIPASELETYGELILKFENKYDRHHSVKVEKSGALVDQNSIPLKRLVSNVSPNTSTTKKAKTDEKRTKDVSVNKKAPSKVTAPITKKANKESTESNENDDANKLFGRMVAAQLSKLTPEGNLRAIIEIQKVIHKIFLGMSM